MINIAQRLLGRIEKAKAREYQVRKRVYRSGCFEFKVFKKESYGWQEYEKSNGSLEAAIEQIRNIDFGYGHPDEIVLNITSNEL